MKYTSFEINAMNKFPDLPPKKAIEEFKKLVAVGGKKGKGKPKPWAHFKNPDAARTAQALSTEAKKSKQD